MADRRSQVTAKGLKAAFESQQMGEKSRSRRRKMADRRSQIATNRLNSRDRIAGNRLESAGRALEMV